MADDREYKELEAELEAYFANESADDHDNSFVPSESDIAQAFARYLSFNNIPSPSSVEHPMAPFLDVGKVESGKDDCSKIYNKEKIKIKGILRNLDGQISISAEMLRDTSCTEYLRLKAHFIDENWELKEWVLRYHALPDDVFVTGIQKGLAAWGIEDKVSTITIKAPNYIEYVDEMAETVKEQVQKKKTLQLGGKLFHVYCCAELLNRMVQVAFREVSKTIDKIKTLINWGRSEPAWHITSSRLKMAIEMKSEGEFDSVEPSVFHEVPSVEEWEKVEGVCKVLDVIETVAKLLFLKKNSTSCDFLGNLVKLKERLTSETEKSDDFVRRVVAKMLKKLDKYLKNMFLVLAIATVMDPRCKMHYIKYICSKTEAGQVSTASDAVRTLYSDYCSVSISNLKRKMKEENSTENPEEEDHVKVNPSCSSQKSDLDLYLEDPVVSWSQDFNILSWWKGSSSKYPTLEKMARDFLSIPWLVITSYDAYYTEERTVDVRMASKGVDFMNALMCTRSWSTSKRS